MADHGWKEAAALAISEKRCALVKEIANAEKAVERAVAKASGLKNDLESLDTSVRVLGIDILDAVAAPDDEAADQGAPLVKELVLKALEDSYPAPMKAADVKIAIEKEIGRVVHDKTPGMTLYRLSKDNLVHRQGRDWYFVPQKTPSLADAMQANLAARQAQTAEALRQEKYWVDARELGEQRLPDDEDLDWRE